MSILKTTRRCFLKGALILTGGLVFSVRMVNKAYAETLAIRDYMAIRIRSVYGADAQFKNRPSQDNEQVQQMYADYYGKPLSHRAHENLHTKWFDKSSAVKALAKAGKYPYKRSKEFAGSGYDYEKM